MAIHYSISGLVQEALLEKIYFSKQAIEYRKDINVWGSYGCLGYPALTLLMSIVDTIGSYVLDGSVRHHFDILNEPSYYNLNLREEDISIIYEEYRCLQTHNSAMGLNCYMDIGEPQNLPFELVNNRPTILLVPLHNATVRALNYFLQNAETIFLASTQYQRIIDTSRF